MKTRVPLKYRNGSARRPRKSSRPSRTRPGSSSSGCRLGNDQCVTNTVSHAGISALSPPARSRACQTAKCRHLAQRAPCGSASTTDNSQMLRWDQLRAVQAAAKCPSARCLPAWTCGPSAFRTRQKDGGTDGQASSNRRPSKLRTWTSAAARQLYDSYLAERWSRHPQSSLSLP